MAAGVKIKIQDPALTPTQPASFFVCLLLFASLPLTNYLPDCTFSPSNSLPIRSVLHTVGERGGVKSSCREEQPQEMPAKEWLRQGKCVSESVCAPRTVCVCLQLFMESQVCVFHSLSVRFQACVYIFVPERPRPPVMGCTAWTAEYQNLCCLSQSVLNAPPPPVKCTSTPTDSKYRIPSSLSASHLPILFHF